MKMKRMIMQLMKLLKTKYKMKNPKFKIQKPNLMIKIMMIPYQKMKDHQLKMMNQVISMMLTMKPKKKSHSMMMNSTPTEMMDLKTGMTKKMICPLLRKKKPKTWVMILKLYLKTISPKNYKKNKNPKIQNKKSWILTMNQKKPKMKSMNKSMKMKF